ncbi:transcriptional repressor [candidate division KSB1 bacterium]|nr:transcriptional repressor [candidate division KSB1 bacterium]
MEEYKKILIAKGIKPTFQRIKILEYLSRNRTHPTVDMIYTALFKKVPTLSKTTVYNTLDILRENGLVDVLTITESEMRYEYCTEPHHHFLCRRCGRIIDLDVKCPYLEKMKFGEHKLEQIHGYFKGICKDCLEEAQ